MRRQRASRRSRPNLLARPPLGAFAEDRGWSAVIIDPVDQLDRLADLRARGVLSPEEFERQKTKVLEP